ncbi:MAG: uridine kinase [Proteobacteria bacterium]|nr:uridine kinase [Pseudomonadota bacterium]
MIKKDTRKHLPSRLMRESLVSKEVIRGTQIRKEFRILPDVNLIKIGGRSIMDRGKAGLENLVEEIGRLRKQYRIIIGVGGGARERHTYSLGVDLGLPTGGLATIAKAMSEQNALMLQVLLAKHGAIRTPQEHFEELPLYLANGAIPVITAMPPYQYWEHPPQRGRIPPHGSDTGMFLFSETFGTRPLILLKDVDGLYTADPRKNKNVRLIPRIGARELLDLNPPGLPLERKVVELILRARNATEVRIINGLVPGNLTRALRGGKVGTIIFKDGK